MKIIYYNTSNYVEFNINEIKKIYNHKMTEMIEITKKEVPDFLRKGQFYFQLEEKNGDSFIVPIDKFKRNVTVNGISDFLYLFETCEYWAVEEYPITLLEYYVLQINLIKTKINETYFNRIKFILFPHCQKQIKHKWCQRQFNFISSKSISEWNITSLSCNPNITWDIVYANLELPWNYKYLSC